MSLISLIVPGTRDEPFRNGELATYRRLLLEQDGVDGVEVIWAGSTPGERSIVGVHPMIQVVDEAADNVSLLRQGLTVAKGELLVILDPSREYGPEALLQVLNALRTSTADVVVGVPRSSRRLLSPGGVRGKTLSILGRLALGTSDGLSGLAALRRSAVRSLVMENQKISGSRILLDVLTWCSGRLVDVPVNTGRNDQRRIDAVRLDDVRQLKRVLDHRFGTLSRLVQFCLVGASGMFVDLSLYALLLWFLASVGFGGTVDPGRGFTWPMFVAGSLSIWAAMSWNFLLNRRLTFNDTRAGSIVRQYLTYALGNALGIVVSLTLRLYLPSRFGVFARHRLAAAVVGIVVATGISFSMSRWIVFRRKPGRPGPVAEEATPDASDPEKALV
ncbi:GtrA family protein [Paludisphaera mucosa]|uniref:GtrA family protein n=1 Tax=Paludisphaera mucosa TaxID=3030827 RepID=A0ABT6FF77_9BACT|nr:GtrA family protein [Paludisphaera mucosa]MDG3006230.1 GtrA family protein [Paludisphaera mucosa]